MFPSRVVVLSLLATLALPLRAQLQPPAPLATDVVVTAEAEPEPAKDLAVAATVIGRDEIERSRKTSLPDLLRSVPGLDVVQSGGPGGVASLFLRGTNSNQILVLVDGVKLNSPFFGGVDLSPFSVADVDRIEVVRGPFSALYGSEAVGGVIQIITRKNADRGLSVSGFGGLGNASAREGRLDASLNESRVQATFGFRRTTIEGDLPNDFWSVTSAAGSLSFDVTPEARVGLIVRGDGSRTGIPFSGGTFTPRRSTASQTMSFALPVSVSLGALSVLEAQATYVADRGPTFSDPDDVSYSRSETDARRTGGRITLSHTWGAQRLSVGAGYERTKVDNEDLYGVNLDGASTRTWSVFAEDRIALLGDALVATAGLRYDDHSAYGSHTSPRLSAAYRLVPAVKLRAAVGSAFRSPTNGELFFPYSGNPNLSPERSVSYEVGAEWDAAPRLVLETSVFRNDIKDLIQYDFTTQANRNVGRARTQGVELVVRGALGPRLFTRASYTYLDATDRDRDRALLRRPHQRASMTVGGSLASGASAELTALFVGRRADVDAQTFARVTDPSYVRLDLAATSPRFLLGLSAFARVTNLLGRDIVEVAGFPSPGRRFLVGLGLDM